MMLAMMLKRLSMKNNSYFSWKQIFIPLLGLFTSLTTLVCCALPALLITIGMGATLASLIGFIPLITKVSDYKIIIFVVSAIIIIFGFLIQWNSRNYPCPTDPIKAYYCKILRKLSWTILFLSLVIFVLGGFYAFFAIYFLN